MKKYKGKYVSSRSKEIGYISGIFKTNRGENVPATFLHFLLLLVEETNGKVLRKKFYRILKKIGYRNTEKGR